MIERITLLSTYMLLSLFLSTFSLPACPCLSYAQFINMRPCPFGPMLRNLNFQKVFG